MTPSYQSGDDGAIIAAPQEKEDRAVAPRARGIPGARSVYHMGVNVPDLEQAIAFFADVIGCDLLWRDGPMRDDTGQSMVERLAVGARTVVTVAMVRCGPDFNVELLQCSGDPDAVTAEPRNSDAGGRHLAFYVDDIDAAAAYLRAQAGVRVLAGPTLNDAGPTAGMRFLYFQTPWGMSMELDQVPAHMPYEQRATGRLSGPAPGWNAGRPGMTAGEQEPA